MKRVLAAVVCLLVLQAAWAVADEETDKLKKKLKAIEKRLMKVERKAATDRLDFTGDFRFEAHNIQADMPDHFDGMALQNHLVNTMFYVFGDYQTFADPMGMPQNPFPTSVDDVNGYLVDNFASYLFFTQNLTFDQLKTKMGAFSPDQQMGLMQLLMPGTYTEGYDVDDDILYTLRLRLRMAAKVADNVDFSGRLAMYKPYGESTGVQVFNGQSNSINIDGNTAAVPNSDILRVERAYFDWRNIGGSDFYLSIGRRPSSGGPPMNFRQDEPRGGSPLGVVIDFQFDGITAGYHIGETSTARLCYGLGYDSWYGSGAQLKQPADRLKDAHFLGLNWDIYDTDDTYIQTTVARAFDVTDGFNGLIVLPNDPVTGAPIPAPFMMRFTPSANLGDIDLASLLVVRNDGPLDYFASFSLMKSKPENVTTPFGGLFSDPFETPEEQDATMFYAGARYTFPNEKTKFGVEYNHGSEYWFNFAVAADDIIAPKTNTRGDVWEAYLTHRITPKFLVKLDYIKYNYDYSGSGWQLGSPKDLDKMPVLGFPTYDSASKIALSFMARF